MVVASSEIVSALTGEVAGFGLTRQAFCLDLVASSGIVGASSVSVDASSDNVVALALHARRFLVRGCPFFTRRCPFLSRRCLFLSRRCLFFVSPLSLFVLRLSLFVSPLSLQGTMLQLKASNTTLWGASRSPEMSRRTVFISPGRKKSRIAEAWMAKKGIYRGGGRAAAASIGLRCYECPGGRKVQGARCKAKMDARFCWDDGLGPGLPSYIAQGRSLAFSGNRATGWRGDLAGWTGSGDAGRRDAARHPAIRCGLRRRAGATPARPGAGVRRRGAKRRR